MRRVVASGLSKLAFIRSFTVSEVISHNRYSQLRRYLLQNENVGKQTYSLHAVRRTFFSTRTPISCWNCQNNSKSEIAFVCDSCGMIQDPIKTLDFFEILSIETKFGVDATKLTSNFRRLQNVVHPDKYSNKSDREQTNSQEWSSLINKAYKTLQTPIERGQYLLKLKGIEMPRDNSALNKEFLMEMMERNEEVEDAETPKDLNDLLQTVKNDLVKEAVELEQQFESENYEAAKFKLVKMKYLKSLEKSIGEKQERML